jgi:PKHD-type hydroxylase
MYYLKQKQNNIENLHACYNFVKPLENKFIYQILNLAESKSSPPELKAWVGEDIYDFSIRNSNIKWLKVNDQTKGLYSLLENYINLANNDAFNFNLTTSFDDIQYTKYESTDKGHYNWYQDTTTQHFVNRKLSIVIQLSDPNEYQGGNLELYDYAPNKKYKDNIINIPKQKGQIVVFPSYLWHRVTPVTKGIRKSLVWWVGGSPLK